MHCVGVLDTAIRDGNVRCSGQPQSHTSYFELMIDASKTPIPIRLELGGEMHAFIVYEDVYADHVSIGVFKFIALVA